MASMNLAPSNNLDLDRTLNRMLLWLAPPERVMGDTARRLCRGEWWKVERKRGRRRRRKKAS
jgi:hypothetical protein